MTLNNENIEKEKNYPTVTRTRSNISFLKLLKALTSVSKKDGKNEIKRIFSTITKEIKAFYIKILICDRNINLPDL